MLSFICMSCRSLFVLLYFFLLVIVLFVLHRYTDSDYPFGIFKPFLWSFLVDTNVQVIFSVCLYTWCCWRPNYQGPGWLNEVGSWIT